MEVSVKTEFTVYPLYKPCLEYDYNAHFEGVRFICGLHLVIRDLKQDDAFSTTWWPVPSIGKCCQATSLSIQRTYHHVLLKQSCCLRSLLSARGKRWPI